MKKLISIAVLCMLMGCTQVIVSRKPILLVPSPPHSEFESEWQWSIDVKVNTLLKDIDFSELDVPNIINLTKYKGLSKDVKATTPYGIIETEATE